MHVCAYMKQKFNEIVCVIQITHTVLLYVACFYSVAQFYILFLEKSNHIYCPFSRPTSVLTDFLFTAAQKNLEGSTIAI